MLRRLANDIGPAAVGLNETTVPLAGANATAAPRLVCGCTTRKVSAAAVLVTDRARTAPTRAAMRLMATAGRRPEAWEAPPSPRALPELRPRAPRARCPRDRALDRAGPRRPAVP